MSAARKLAPAAPRPDNDPLAAIPPELRPFVRALAALVVADLERRPPAK